MSYNLGNLTITNGAKTKFQAPIEGVQAILIGCESGLTCTITLESGGVQKTLYPGTVDWFTVRKGFTGNIIISPIALLSNVSTYPASTLIFDAIGLNDSEQASMYPLALPSRNTNIGNVINTVGGVATAIQNDTNALGTSIVESTVNGDTGSSVSLTNDAVMVLGDAAHKGSLTMAGALTIAGTIFANGGINANTLRDDTNGNTALDMTAGTGDVAMPHSLTVTGALSSDAAKLVTDGAGTLELSKAAASVAGSATGTAKFYTPIWGASLKILIVVMNNYNSTGTATFIFPLAAAFGMFYCGTLGASMTFAFFNGASQQNVATTTAFGGAAAGTSGTVTNIHGDSLGQFANTTVDRIVLGSTATTAHTTTLVFIGI